MGYRSISKLIQFILYRKIFQKKVAETESGGYILTYALSTIFGMILLAFLAIALIIYNQIEVNNEGHASPIYVYLFVILVMFTLFYSMKFCNKAYVDNQGVFFKYIWLTTDKFILWNEVRKIDYSSFTKKIKIYSNGDACITLDAFMIGIDIFWDVVSDNMSDTRWFKAYNIFRLDEDINKFR